MVTWDPDSERFNRGVLWGLRPSFNAFFSDYALCFVSSGQISVSLSIIVVKQQASQFASLILHWQNDFFFFLDRACNL